MSRQFHYLANVRHGIFLVGQLQFPFSDEPVVVSVNCTKRSLTQDWKCHEVGYLHLPLLGSGKLLAHLNDLSSQNFFTQPTIMSQSDAHQGYLTISSQNRKIEEKFIKRRHIIAASFQERFTKKINFLWISVFIWSKTKLESFQPNKKSIQS